MTAIGKYNVLVIGNPFSDQFFEVPDQFLAENKLGKGLATMTNERSEVEATRKNALQSQPNTESEWKIGGSGCNVAKVLGHLREGKVGVKGMIGDDETGTSIEMRLKQMKVNTLFSKGVQKTGVVNCFITPDRNRTMHTYLGAAVEFSEKELVASEFRGVDLVHLEGYASYYGNAVETTISHAKKVDAKVSLDLASANVVEDFFQKFKKNIPKVDILFGNEMEMQMLTGETSMQVALEDFDSNQTVVATVGENGCWVKEKGETDPVHYDAIKVSSLVDTTGAGDFFVGGYLNGYLGKHSTQQCVTMGNYAASHVIQELGADLTETGWELLKKQMKMV